jgi:hypothetical protein
MIEIFISEPDFCQSIENGEQVEATVFSRKMEQLSRLINLEVVLKLSHWLYPKTREYNYYNSKDNTWKNQTNIDNFAYILLKATDGPGHYVVMVKRRPNQLPTTEWIVKYVNDILENKYGIFIRANDELNMKLQNQEMELNLLTINNILQQDMDENEKNKKAIENIWRTDNSSNQVTKTYNIEDLSYDAEESNNEDDDFIQFMTPDEEITYKKREEQLSQIHQYQMELFMSDLNLE